MNCPKCRKPLSPNENICSRCGAVIQTNVTKATTIFTDPKFKNVRILLIISLIVFTVAAFIILGFIGGLTSYFRSRSAPPDSSDKKIVIHAETKPSTENITMYDPTTAPLTTEMPTTQAPTTQNPTEPVTEKVTIATTPIYFVNYTNYVQAGSTATVTIQGAPYTNYTINVYYSSGASDAEGLEQKQSDENGYVTWEWIVGARTKPGVYEITVHGGGVTDGVTFEVL